MWLDSSEYLVDSSFVVLSGVDNGFIEAESVTSSWLHSFSLLVYCHGIRARFRALVVVIQDSKKKKSEDCALACWEGEHSGSLADDSLNAALKGSASNLRQNRLNYTSCSS